MPALNIPTNKLTLFHFGVRRCKAFCKLNKIPEPPFVSVASLDWMVDACAYYRPDTPQCRQRFTHVGCVVCVEKCQHPAGHEQSRNWSWPGNIVDRTPYGVVCHELGHHADYTVGEAKGAYYSEACVRAKEEAGEEGITSYADDNPAEWYAEAFRLFLTNPDLLREFRPATYEVLCQDWKPLGEQPWEARLGSNVPERVVRSIRNKLGG